MVIYNVRRFTSFSVLMIFMNKLIKVQIKFQLNHILVSIRIFIWTATLNSMLKKKKKHLLKYILIERRNIYRKTKIENHYKITLN